MYYLQSRYYNPEWGRFISADDLSYIKSRPPIKLNAYAYCGNNPIKYVDPYGHDFTWDSIFDIILACIVIDFEFPEFRIPVSTSGSHSHSSKPSNNVTVQKSNWVSDIGEIIGVVITEIFTCWDLQVIASDLNLDFRSIIYRNISNRRLKYIQLGLTTIFGLLLQTSLIH